MSCPTSSPLPSLNRIWVYVVRAATISRPFWRAFSGHILGTSTRLRLDFARTAETSTHVKSEMEFSERRRATQELTLSGDPQSVRPEGLSSPVPGFDLTPGGALGGRWDLSGGRASFWVGVTGTREWCGKKYGQNRRGGGGRRYSSGHDPSWTSRMLPLPRAMSRPRAAAG